VLLAAKNKHLKLLHTAANPQQFTARERTHLRRFYVVVFVLLLSPR
jgi:hypothetical protein